MDLSILYDREGFRQQVIDTLAQEPVDYLEQLRFIDMQRKTQEPWEGGGVLLPLFFREEHMTRREKLRSICLSPQ